MSTDTYDTVLGLLLQATGNNNNAWGTNANNSDFIPLAMAIAGVNTITNTSGTVDLSTVAPPTGLRLDVAKIQLANGALSGDITIKVPNISKTWEFWNQTTNAFNMFVQVPSGVARTGPNAPGGLVQIPQNCCVKVKCDGNGHLIREDDALIGTFSISGKVAAGPGEVLCNGASALKTALPDLFGKIGTQWGTVDGTHFTMPLLTDTNRYLRAADGTNVTVGQYQASQNKTHTHTGSGTTATESVGHTHTQQGTFTSSGMSANVTHTHSEAGSLGDAQVAAPQSGNALLINAGGTTGATNIQHSHDTTIGGQTGGESTSHTHTYSFTTSTGSADGADARPESAGVLICIRY